MKVTVGTNDKKKVAILGGLLAVAAIVFWINSSSGDVPVNTPARTANLPKTTTPLVAPRHVNPDTPARARTGTTAANRTLQEFRPSLKPKRPEDRPDPMSIDPTLRLDVLEKIQQVNIEGVHRNLFDFGAAPPPVEQAKGPGGKKPALPNPIVDAQANLNAQPVQPPPPPPPPKIPWKFYGFLAGQARGAKQAFFLDGDDIHVVGEGDVVKKRFKIVKIGVNSVIVEDMDFHNQQTLPLEEAPNG
jgi:hypothetical protein